MTTTPLEPVVVLDLSGQLDGTAAAAVSDGYARATEGLTGPATVVLDFADVTYINSTGIALVVGLLGRARGAGHRVVALGLTAHYRHIFEITRLSDFLAVAEDMTADDRAAVADRLPARRVAVPSKGPSPVRDDAGTRGNPA